jgi:hypothetical protein
MVVNHFHVVRFAVDPTKANPIAIVHPNAILPGSVTLQCLQPVARWNRQIGQSLRAMEETQPPQSNPGNRTPTAGRLAKEQQFRFAVTERSNHFRLLYYM